MSMVLTFDSKPRWCCVSREVIDRNQWCSNTIGIRNLDWLLSYETHNGFFVWSFSSKDNLTLFELVWD